MVLANKKEGELLSELTERVLLENNISPDTSITYAGRLDPMAEGIVLFLVGSEEIKEKEKYLSLSKVYEFEILFGISADTHDVLGLVDDTSQTIPTLEEVHAIKNRFIGEQKQSYPRYSSKTVKGKPLFTYARAGEEVELPEHVVQIYSLEIKSGKTILLKEVLEEIVDRVSKVHGDFRQELSVESWKRFSEKNPTHRLFLATCSATVSSGTYIRVLASDIAKALGSLGIAYRIIRTKIGDFSLSDAKFSKNQ